MWWDLSRNRLWEGARTDQAHKSRFIKAEDFILIYTKECYCEGGQGNWTVWPECSVSRWRPNGKPNYRQESDVPGENVQEGHVRQRQNLNSVDVGTRRVDVSIRKVQESCRAVPVLWAKDQRRSSRKCSWGRWGGARSSAVCVVCWGLEFLPCSSSPKREIS